MTSGRTPSASNAIRVLTRASDARRARILQGFFKTGPGEYGEGDRFLGLTVPQVRSLVREFAGMSRAEALKLLRSPWHEVRLFALLLMVRRYETGDEAERERVYRAYLANTDRINNWDLVDLSSHEIVGAHLLSRSRKPLYALAKSDMLWDRRIAIVSTYRFIRHREFADTLKIAMMLLGDRHDLIHKATGWMLREVGKRDVEVLRGFLDRHHKAMPRTALRYSIERLPVAEKKRYMRRD